MKLYDLTSLAIANIRQSKLRTFLTTLGVVIGIGALVSMVSFGLGMQKNVSRAFQENDLFTTIYVMPRIQRMTEEPGNPLGLQSVVEGAQTAALSDSAVAAIQQIKGVEIAYPQVSFPVKILLHHRYMDTKLQAIPANMRAYPPFNDVPYGAFFTSDSEKVALVSLDLLQKLKLRLRRRLKSRISLEDSLKGHRSVLLDSILGQPIEIISKVPDIQAVMSNPFAVIQNPDNLPFREVKTKLKIIGILKKRDEFDHNRISTQLVVPAATAQSIPRLGFNSVFDLLRMQSGMMDAYASLYVRVSHIHQVKEVKQQIEIMGFNTFAMVDQLEEFQRGFLILDTALGAVGTIALIVAALGIINTLIMSILERTREIGIMKSIGGSETEIKSIFIAEAGVIGFSGGVLGVCLGWIVTRIANAVANYYFAKEGLDPVNFFHIPFWLILSAVGFSVMVSVLSGLYPAARAVRINPVEALRHD